MLDKVVHKTLLRKKPKGRKLTDQERENLPHTPYVSASEKDNSMEQMNIDVNTTPKNNKTRVKCDFTVSSGSLDITDKSIRKIQLESEQVQN